MVKRGVGVGPNFSASCQTKLRHLDKILTQPHFDFKTVVNVHNTLAFTHNDTSRMNDGAMKKKTTPLPYTSIYWSWQVNNNFSFVIQYLIYEFLHDTRYESGSKIKKFTPREPSHFPYHCIYSPLLNGSEATVCVCVSNFYIENEEKNARESEPKLCATFNPNPSTFCIYMIFFRFVTEVWWISRVKRVRERDRARK